MERTPGATWIAPGCPSDLALQQICAATGDQRNPPYFLSHPYILLLLVWCSLQANLERIERIQRTTIAKKGEH